MQRDSMVFYRSFHEATRELPPEIYKEAIVALMDYALDGRINEVSAYANMFLQMAKPQVDANNQRYINGSKGGRKPEPKSEKGEVQKTKSEPKRNQIGTKPEPNVNVNVNDNVLNTSDASVSSPKEKNGFKMLLKGGEEYLIDQSEVEIYKELFPEVDVEQQIRFMCSWCMENPSKRKTKRGIGRFINGWLTKEAQEVSEKAKPKGKNLNNFERRRYDMDDLEERLLNS